MDWLFAYGSLIPAGLTALPQGVLPCSLLGWQRSWGVAMDNTRDLPGYKHYLLADGSRPAVMVAFLDISVADGAETNGIVLPVDPEELPGLDARERNYERVEVTGQLDRPLTGRVWTYAGCEASRERARRGAREGGLVIARGYRDRVLAGFDLLGQRDVFEALTGSAPPVAELQLVADEEPASPRAARPGG